MQSGLQALSEDISQLLRRHSIHSDQAKVTILDRLVPAQYVSHMLCALSSADNVVASFDA